MMIKARLSIVIPAFRAERTIGEAVRSVLDQSVSALEVIVVDDGSDDGTRQRVEALAAGDGRVRLLSHEDRRNHGVAPSRNLGVRAASADHVAFLDADDVWLPHTAEKLLGGFDRYPEVGVVYGTALSFGDGTNEPLGRGVPDRPVWLFAQFARFNVVVTSATAARASILSQEPFPEGLPFQFEDWACWLDCAQRTPFLFVSDTLARYRVWPSSATRRIVAEDAEIDFERAQIAHLQRMRRTISPSKARVVRAGLRFRAGEALRNAAAAAKHGEWEAARAWLSTVGATLSGPTDIAEMLVNSAHGHRGALKGEDPPLTVTVADPS